MLTCGWGLFTESSYIFYWLSGFVVTDWVFKRGL
jgi:hypothetical protein